MCMSCTCYLTAYAIWHHALQNIFLHFQILKWMVLFLIDTILYYLKTVKTSLNPLGYGGEQEPPKLLTVFLYRKCFWHIDDIGGCTYEAWLLLRNLNYDEKFMQVWGEVACTWRYCIMGTYLGSKFYNMSCFRQVCEVKTFRWWVHWAQTPTAHGHIHKIKKLEFFLWFLKQDLKRKLPQCCW